MTNELDLNSEKLFFGKKVFLSTHINNLCLGSNLHLNIANYMEENGAIVLSKYVAITNEDERNKVFIQRTGIDRYWPREDWVDGDASPAIREVSLNLVDDSTHFVAFVDTPSFGVGIEIQEALRKHKMGMNLTPVLCLIQKENWNNEFSHMVRGIGMKDSPVAYVSIYENETDATKMIKYFLTSH